MLGRARSDAPYARALNVNSKPLTLSSFPDFYNIRPNTTIATAGYGNECSFPIDLTTSELLNSPALYNPLRNTGNSRLLDAMDTHSLIARFNSPLDYGDSILSKLIPNNLTSAVVRHRITLVSADVGRAGLMPQTASWTAGSMSEWTMPMTPPGPQIPMAQKGEPFQPTFTYPGPAQINFPNDFIGTPLTTFAPVTRPTTGQPPPPPGGSLQSIVDVTSGQNIYSFDGRSGVANLYGRLDLNRPLAPYPALVPAPGTNPGVTYSANSLAQIQRANTDRSEFAHEIFERLQAAVGAPSTSPPPAAGTPEHDALKYLAQLAVNIVDDIDEDDVMTVFHWNEKWKPTPAPELVYGVEMPKVAINEVYVEQTNGDGNPGGDYLTNDSTPRAKKYKMNVWTELHHTMVPPYINTFPPGAPIPPGDKYGDFRNRHAVYLNNTVMDQTNGTPSAVSTYRIQLIKSGTAIPNVEDQPGNISPDMNMMAKVVTFSNATKKIFYPVDTSITDSAMPPKPPRSYRARDSVNDTGFYTVGPSSPGPQGASQFGDPPQEPTLKTDAMSYDVDVAAGAQLPPRIVLQRLANPYLPYQPNATMPLFNPYITVDSMTLTGGSLTNNGIIRLNQYDQAGTNPSPDTTKSTVMRRQPFAGAIEHLVMSNMIQPGPDNETMFRHNGRTNDPTTLTLPEANNGLERFDWYVHHDRKLTSPMELTHVAAVAPWDVTQKFISNHPTAAGTKIRQGHTALWFDKFEQYDITPTAATPYSGRKVDISVAGGPQTSVPSTRLYRALEQFRVGDRAVEMAFGGRDIGKININTIWDPEIFRALCDAWVDPTNPNTLDAKRGFTQRDVDLAWAALTDKSYNLSARSPFLNVTVPRDTGVGLTPGTYATSYVDPSPTSAGTQVSFSLPYSRISRYDQPFLGIGSPHMGVSTQYLGIPTGKDSAGQQLLPPRIRNIGIEGTLFRSLVKNTDLVADMNNVSYQSPPNRAMVLDAESQTGWWITQQSGADPSLANMTHPMLEKSMLSKIFEHLTTRSNVFAVYMTVGYFEVTDDTQKPELLGDEIGIIRDATGVIVENKAIRHRMFAIIDRTNLSLQPPRFEGTSFTGEDVQKQGPAPFYYTVPVGLQTAGTSSFWTVELPIVAYQGQTNNATNVTGSYNGISWMLQTNDVLFVGTGSEQRRLVIRGMTINQATAADGSTVATATVLLAAPSLTGGFPPMDANTPVHPVLVTNVIAGNPGPQPDFDHRLPNYRGVVLYSVIMD